MKDRKKNIAIIHEHYHVTDAGVRHILESLTRGIAKYFERASQYLWYSPQKIQHHASPCERFSAELITLIEDKKLGYRTTRFASLGAFETAIENRKHEKLGFIKQRLQDEGTVVHLIQNPTLLKNPVETQANARIASELLGENYLQIWHIHDFLEDSHSRQDLRDFVKTFAGDQTEEIYGPNGGGMAWTTSPNIFYAMINLKDKSALRGFLPHSLKEAVFYFPNPVDVDLIRVPPLSPRQFGHIDDLINAYCQSNAATGYTYDDEADLILATEFARERKNTGEQILLLNLLNSMNCRPRPKFQLLITMIPSSGKDAERMKIFQEYIRLNNLPVVMGFGSSLIARGANAKADQFNIADLWNHPRAGFVISTSLKEGFGLNFVNPAIATMDSENTLLTVGRRLRDIFPDFEALGMTLHDRAFYDSIMIDASILSEDADIFDSAREHVLKDRLPHRYKTISYDGKISMGKDFSCYPADEQILLMDLIDLRKLSDRLSAFIGFISEKERMHQIARRNADVIIHNLSLSSYVETLKEIIEKGFSYKRERLEQGEHPLMIRDNSYLMDYFANF